MLGASLLITAKAKRCPQPLRGTKGWLEKGGGLEAKHISFNMGRLCYG